MSLSLDTVWTPYMWNVAVCFSNKQTNPVQLHHLGRAPARACTGEYQRTEIVWSSVTDEGVQRFGAFNVDQV